MLIKSSVVIMPIASPWYTCFESFKTCPPSFILHEIWALCHVTHCTCVCVCLSVCVQPAKIIKTNASVWCVQLILCPVEEKQVPRTAKMLFVPFSFGMLEVLRQGHKFLCHKTCHVWCPFSDMVTEVAQNSIFQWGNECRNCAQDDCCNG